MPQKFLKALARLPECGGIALGMDRLVMLFFDAALIDKVLPFTAFGDDRPVLQCVLFVAKDGKLTLVSADGFRLAVVTLDCDGEGQALVNREELRGIANALKPPIVRP
jgi:DNA polymerase III sliding clamp (beta) subunit (PCNA family)